jgi:hypothetical protein
VHQLSSIFVAPRPTLGNAWKHRTTGQFLGRSARVRRVSKSHGRTSLSHPHQDLTPQPAAHINASFRTNRISLRPVYRG